jgi:hypothetical protein
MQWWALQDPGSDPYGLIVLDDKAAVRRYVPGVGLVRSQSDADHVFLGELGARPVEPDEALGLIAVRRAGRRRPPGRQRRRAAGARERGELTWPIRRSTSSAVRSVAR